MFRWECFRILEVGGADTLVDGSYNGKSIMEIPA